MMKRIYNYILIAAFSVAVASCNNEELNPDKPSAESGDDVQFGLTLGDPETKTVYGDETNNTFPIYWINGDKVQIFSPQCLDGRRSAEYEVSVSEPQNYADALNKTGEYGLQWGDSENAIFYSLYPSGAYTLSSDGKEAQGITINYSQNIVVNGNEVKSDMEDCLMYAKNDGGEDNESKGVPRGQTVNLKYTPISTVFMVTLNVDSDSVDDFTIQSVSLVAPAGTDIAGTFSLKVADGSFVKFADNKSSNTVLTQISDKNTSGFYTLAKGKGVTIPIFLAPVTGLKTDGWKITVKANNKEYIKNLTSQDVVAGQIHKVILPSLSTTTTEWETGNWMENIPRNVYLSEISIPGTWNSLNTEFQSDTDISNQYTNGVRAFHFDTRWKRTGSFWSGYNYALGTADNSGSTGTNGNKYMNSEDNPTFRENLTKIVDLIKENTQEYMVVVCSFAQGSAQRNGANGWIKEISSICDEFPEVYDARKITKNTVVGDIIGKVIVIVNVESSITDSSLPSQLLAENSKCFFSYTPSEVPKDRFVLSGDDNNSITLLDKNNDPFWTTTTSTAKSDISIYSTQAQISSNTDEGIATSNRGYAPTMAQRLEVLNKIVDWSRANYGTTNYVHDKWIYFGLGGYRTSSSSASTVAGSHSVVENILNVWINNIVMEMGTTPDGQKEVPFYPVGIVLMNNKKGGNYTDDNDNDLKYGFNNVVKNILLLNNKYQLQYDPSKTPDYNPNQIARSAAPSYSSGMNDSDVAAFGWD